MLYFITSEFLEPKNVKFDINIVIFGQLNAKLGVRVYIQCMLASMLLLLTF